MKEKSRIHNGYTQFVKLIIFKDGNCYLKWDWNKMAPQFNPPPVEFIGAIPKEQAKRAYPNVPLRDWDNQHLSKDDRRLVERTETLIEFLKNPTIKLSDWPSNIKDTSSCMGVGDGTGKLFVYGTHESIIAARNIILERDELRKKLKDLTVSNHPVKDTPYVEWLDKRVDMKIKEPILLNYDAFNNNRFNGAHPRYLIDELSQYPIPPIESIKEAQDQHEINYPISFEKVAQMQYEINNLKTVNNFLIQERKYYIDLLTEQAERTKLQREGTIYGTPFDESLPHLDRLKLDYLKSKETAGQDFLSGIQDIETIKEMFRNPAKRPAFNQIFFPLFFDTRGNPILPAASITADENASQETKNALAEMINIASNTVKEESPAIQMNRLAYYKQLQFHERIAVKEWLHWPGRSTMSLSDFLTKKDANPDISQLIVRTAVVEGKNVLNGAYKIVTYLGQEMFGHKKNQLQRERFIKMKL